MPTTEAGKRLLTFLDNPENAQSPLEPQWVDAIEAEAYAQGHADGKVPWPSRAEAIAAERERIRPYMATIKEALRIGAICFDGDSWYVSRDALGDHGYDLDDAEKVLGDARAAVLAIIDEADHA